MSEQARVEPPHPSEQRLKPDQSLVETWKVDYEVPRAGAPVVARLHHWPNATVYCVHGEGQTVDEARLDLIAHLASAIAADDDPIGRKP